MEFTEDAHQLSGFHIFESNRPESAFPGGSHMDLMQIIKDHRRGIAIATALVVIENIAWIVEPTAFGRVIDAMIDAAGKSGISRSLVIPLLVWGAVFGVNSGVGTLRRSVDQRIFLRMFTDIATTVSMRSQEQGLSNSRAAIRAQLSREYIHFFQYRVPEIIEQAIAISGALVGMAFFDYRIAAACSFITIPLVIISRTYSKKVTGLQTEFHDGVEETYDIFSSGDPSRVRAYYNAIAVPQQKIANWGAASFGLMRFVLLGVFLVVLYIAIDLDDFTTGNIYTIVAYIWTFVTSSEYLPELMESATSLKDISRRLHKEADEPGAGIPGA